MIKAICGRAAVLTMTTCAVASAFAQSERPSRFSAYAVEADVRVQDDWAQATFKIKVDNNEESPMNNFIVVFADGATSSIGDVQAQSTTVSDTQSKIVKVELPGSRSVPMTVTLKFEFDGGQVEVPWTLTLTTTE